jgi:NAD(P)-dependent dehydrogenase (short-subunit alcohol dehydrogenase family)
MASTIIVGGGGLGRVIARRFADRGDTVIVTSRDKARAEATAAEIGGATRGLAVDLSRPETIASAFSDVTEIDHLVITAIDQTPTTLADFDIDTAIAVTTVKLVGYTETVRALRDRFRPGASVVLFGGVAKDRPYPGSTMVTTTNGAINSLVKTLAVELSPHRVNAIHPGIVGDSPKWRDVPTLVQAERTPIKRLVTMDEVAHATEFLLDNTGINAQNLIIEGGVLVA